MKRILTISGVVVAIIALIVFNRLTSKNKNANVYAEVKKGNFEIVVSNSGELIAERSLDVLGPEIRGGPDQGGPMGPGGGGGGGGRGGGGGGMGSDIHASDFKIQDIVPEGTIVKTGDYIAQLERTTYDNTLKDQYTSLQTLQTNLQMKILDTAVVLTNLRDDIKNQESAVEEASITLAQSKYEPPATIRQAEMQVNKAQRNLDQKRRSYLLSAAVTLSQIEHQKQDLNKLTRSVNDLQTFLSKFTITAPAPGMVIYKKDRNGTKRIAGSSVNAFDRVIASLPDLSSMISKIYVNEIEISKVKKDQKVNIVVDALPQKAFTGKVISISNIGEVLPNSDAKMFEVQIRLDNTDPALRPSMTTGNKIIIKSFDDVVYIPSECVQTGADSIPFVYKKNKTKAVVLLGESNDKNVIVEQGLDPRTTIYLIPPENPANFKMVGLNLIPIIKERDKSKRAENAKPL